MQGYDKLLEKRKAAQLVKSGALGACGGVGTQGPPGANGKKGPQGDQGPPGDNGTFLVQSGPKMAEMAIALHQICLKRLKSR